METIPALVSQLRADDAVKNKKKKNSGDNGKTKDISVKKSKSKVGGLEECKQKIFSWEQMEEECPYWSSEEGDVDFSDAALVVLHADDLKPKPFGIYQWLIQFARECRLKCCLQYFRHPGYSQPGLLAVMVGDCITDEERKLARIAIEKYQQVNQNVKLQLRELMKVNYIGPSLFTFYMTFSAENEITGEVRPYQAALVEYLDDEYILGLFRDLIDNKILAILSIKGSEEDRAPRQAEMQKEKQLEKEAKKAKKRKERD